MFIPAHTEIAGYQLGEKIGTGGMGEVYSAWHPVLRRKAAVKILHKIEHTERFRQEAYIQSSVDHPQIARLFEFTYAGKTPCIIMEYVEGEPLDNYLRRQGRLDSQELIPMLVQITGALTYLHEKEIFHRDIKPSNFKRLPDGSVKMLDFGIAKHKYSPRLTQQGFVVGTTEYMAPEQFEQQADLRSDIWSLGVMTYELATGYLPFEATNPVTLRSRISKGSFSNPALFVPDLNKLIRQVIEQCLRINPAQRPTAARLQALLSGKQEIVNDNQYTISCKRSGRTRCCFRNADHFAGLVTEFFPRGSRTRTTGKAGKQAAKNCPNAPSPSMYQGWNMPCWSSRTGAGNRPRLLYPVKTENRSGSGLKQPGTGKKKWLLTCGWVHIPMTLYSKK
jgi:serine/threonine protein kinase